jgi:hypothetical protein
MPRVNHALCVLQMADAFPGRRRLVYACSTMSAMMWRRGGRGRACPGRKRQGHGHKDRKREIEDASHRYQSNGQTTLLRSYAQKQPEKPANCFRLKLLDSRFGKIAPEPQNQRRLSYEHENSC